MENIYVCDKMVSKAYLEPRYDAGEQNPQGRHSKALAESMECITSGVIEEKRRCEWENETLSG